MTKSQLHFTEAAVFSSTRGGGGDTHQVNTLPFISIQIHEKLHSRLTRLHYQGKSRYGVSNDQISTLLKRSAMEAKNVSKISRGPV